MVQRPVCALAYYNGRRQLGEEHTWGNFSEALLDLGDKGPNVAWWSGPKYQAMPPILEVRVTLRVFYFRKNLVDGDSGEVRRK